MNFMHFRQSAGWRWVELLCLEGIEQVNGSGVFTQKCEFDADGGRRPGVLERVALVHKRTEGIKF